MSSLILENKVETAKTRLWLLLDAERIGRPLESERNSIFSLVEAAGKFLIHLLKRFHSNLKL